MIEVFKTNVRESYHAEALLRLLHNRFPKVEFNFDLLDCDKILRVKGFEINADKVKDIVEGTGFYCEILE